ncbi:RecT-like ssDNA binding protein [Gordonia phage Phlop]|uniref:RecT-like ssDNA binding protein n=8 Tax=Wizardvirus TaxID=2169658 RepID=A0A890URC5_9CAUD|nr:RecT-like ssDNA annealing protein [Gordonia phage Wizard]YP_010096756.1 RecT-like ssDNA annealing protein [Gordonia phage KimmyK]YP_010102115.1 RecT-like ssDNA annealing protein [Gordonia phage VanDeWege]YP_010102210.1 RecT-like ssDNA annealing protein [Gordonia phage Barb]YP_010102402.1 RecT-like ssDNA annealing protein [Gordonia phage Valary]YP_010103068.1 RecT-like ssDNA annealing protein [Gordonia phage RogerDodger]YP_010114973.1 RecT-like ssDNA annealing protein [Gordonia phage Phlop]
MTSNELAHQTTARPAAIDPSDRALERIMAQSKAMQAAHQLGSALAATSMVPQAYQGKADDATAAILYGAELGLSAIQSLQNIFIVRGKPAVYSRTMVAQVIAAGHFVYEIEATPESVTWKGRRGDTGVEFTSTWTIERARKAGFTSNKIYESMPIEMLRAKAQAEVCRTMAPDVLLGIAHSREELELEQPRYVRNEAQASTGAAGLRERLAAPVSKPAEDIAPADPPVSDEPPTAEPPAEEKKAAQKLITAAQLKRLHAMLGEAGLGNDRAGALAYMSDVVQRELTTSKDLTSEEVQKVFESLENGGRTTDQ